MKKGTLILTVLILALVAVVVASKFQGYKSNLVVEDEDTTVVVPPEKPIVVTPPTKPNAVTVVSPNGGETWKKGEIKTIKWENNIIFNCPAGAQCSPPMPRQYNIKLINYYVPCDGCAPFSSVAPYLIAENVYGSSYSWKVGDVIPYGASGQGIPTGVTVARDASYTIEICDVGLNECDSSNSHFILTSK